MWERPSDFTVCNASPAIWHGKKGHATGEKMGSMDFRPWCWLRSVRDGPSHAWTERNFCGVQHNSFLRWEGGLLRAGTSCPTIRLFDLKINCRWLAPTGCFTCSLGCHGNQLIKDARPKVTRWPISSNFLFVDSPVPVSKFSSFADFLIHLSAEFLEKKFSSANIEAGTWVELFELFLDFFFSTENDCQSAGFRRNTLNVLTVPLAGQ